jgi:type II secretory pathway component HofQ
MKTADSKTQNLTSDNSENSVQTKTEGTKKTASRKSAAAKTSSRKKTAAAKNSLERRTIEVENALYKRAVGYTADELVFSPEEEGTERCVKIVRKEVAPSIQAQIQWLKAYKPEVWKNGSETDPADPALLYKALTGGASGNFDDDV